MTIPLNNNWCSTCEETVQDHSRICTTCGDALGPPPSSRTTSSNLPPRGSLPSSMTGIRAVPEFMTEDFRQAGREIHNLLLSGLRGPSPFGDLPDGLAQQPAADAAAGALGGEQWEEIPPELLAPQNAAHRGRPTSKATLAKIPRVVLHDKSSLFRQASLSFGNRQYSAIPAEFGPSEGIHIQQASIVIGSPRTAKGGLTEECKRQIKQAQQPLVYLERGDDVTFVHKAFQAQQAGAVAVIIGNNQSTPWPYVMKGSAGEAHTLGLKVPVVMIQQHEGKNLVEYCSHQRHPSSGHPAAAAVAQGELNILSLSMDCVVCCETYNVKDTILTLPACGHVFHEKCALAWLTKHNTCPFCRRELPTEDTEYEQERRRTQRTHAGSAPGGNESQWSAFYG